MSSLLLVGFLTGMIVNFLRRVTQLHNFIVCPTKVSTSSFGCASIMIRARSTAMH